MSKWIAEFELEDGDTMPEHMDLNYKGAKIDFYCRPLEQELIFSRILEKTYNDFCNCEGGEGWLKIDNKEYVTDVGYAIDGVEIFMEILKRRLAESEGYVNFADDLMPIMNEEESEDKG